MSKGQGVWLELPNGAGGGSCELCVRWRRTTVGDMTRLRVEEYGRR